MLIQQSTAHRFAQGQDLVPPEHFEDAVAVNLTQREHVVLQWSAEGKTSWEIAHILQCSESAVNFHFCNIRRKFDVTSRRAALLKALAQGLIHLA